MLSSCLFASSRECPRTYVLHPLSLSHSLFFLSLFSFDEMETFWLTHLMSHFFRKKIKVRTILQLGSITAQLLYEFSWPRTDLNLNLNLDIWIHRRWWSNLVYILSPHSSNIIIHTHTYTRMSTVFGRAVLLCRGAAGVASSVNFFQEGIGLTVLRHTDDWYVPWCVLLSYLFHMDNYFSSERLWCICVPLCIYIYVICIQRFEMMMMMMMKGQNWGMGVVRGDLN